MAHVVEKTRPPPAAVFTERRRPGRLDYQDAQLIALLRGEPTNTSPATPEVCVTRLVDDLASARALVVAVPIGAAMWAVAIFAISYFL